MQSSFPGGNNGHESTEGLSFSGFDCGPTDRSRVAALSLGYARGRLKDAAGSAKR